MQKIFDIVYRLVSYIIPVSDFLTLYTSLFWASLMAQWVKHPPAMWIFLGQEDPLEKEMATYHSILAWEIPRIEESGGLQRKVSQRVRPN